MNNAAFGNKWNNNSLPDGKFVDNTTRDITESDMRDFAGDITTSFINKEDGAYNGVKGAKPGINTIAGLKSILMAPLDIGVYITFRDSENGNALRTYDLVAGDAAESLPNIVRGNDWADPGNKKYWQLSVVGVATNGPYVFEADADGVATDYDVTGYTVDRIVTVYVNGIQRRLGTDYTIVDADTISFTTPPGSGDRVAIMIMGTEIIVSDWILETGFWDDGGVWEDTEVWID